MTYTGRCNCGAITVAIEAEPVGTRQCWCRQCQKIAGGGPTNNAIFPAAAVTLNGKTRQHGYVAASGNTLTQEFCGDCGTPIMAHSRHGPTCVRCAWASSTKDTASFPTQRSG